MEEREGRTGKLGLGLLGGVAALKEEREGRGKQGLRALES